jgi:hypothetical protein
VVIVAGSRKDAAEVLVEADAGFFGHAGRIGIDGL